MTVDIEDMKYLDWILLRDKEITLYRKKEGNSFFYLGSDKYLIGDLSKDDDNKQLPDFLKNFKRGYPSFGKHIAIIEIHLIEDYYMVVIRTNDCCLLLDLGKIIED